MILSDAQELPEFVKDINLQIGEGSFFIEQAYVDAHGAVILVTSEGEIHVAD